MKIRAHLLAGALVLLLSSIASAQTDLSTVPFKRYLAYLVITQLNDSGIRSIVNAGESLNSGAFPLTVPLSGMNATATISQKIGDIHSPAIINYPSTGLEGFFEWKNAHRKTFGSFSYPKGGGEDGNCWVPAGVTVGSKTTNGWQSISFNSWAGNNSSGQPGFRAYVKAATSSGPYQWDIYPGFDVYAAGFSEKIAPLVSLCFDSNKFKVITYFFGDVTYTDLPAFGNPLASLAAAVRPTYAAYLLMSPTPDLSAFSFSRYTEVELNAPCSESTCPQLVNAPGMGGTSPGSGGTAAPPCTKPDGTSSGNPYDCAPKNEETKCGIIDIPCNLKKLFIPDKDFLKSKIEDGVGINVNIPLTVANKWETDITFAGQTFKVGADFSWFDWSEETKDQFNFYAFWGVFLFLLNYLGVPFLSSKRSADAARDATEGAAGRAAAESERINSEYQAMRADDSWKH